MLVVDGVLMKKKHHYRAMRASRYEGSRHDGRIGRADRQSCVS
uniref:Uncharacterized protein n=1 Tax=Encephalitozoon cuniculi TaxID=6035 RepID=M1K5L1_ENCCN|nr:hypothetical protein ECU10_0740 [Encephalitozoon cuniculi]